MIYAKDAKKLTEDCIMDNKIKRITVAKDKYAFVLKDLEQNIRNACAKELTAIRLPNKNGWPANVNYQELGELLHECYQYDCIVIEQFDVPVGLKISWN